MQSDPLADFLSALRNATLVGKREMLSPFSRMKNDVALVLKEEGYIDGVEILTEDKKKPVLKVTLRGNNRNPVIRGIKRISKPGRRHYVGVSQIPRVLGGLGVAILSTPQGVMSGHKAKKMNLGGELLLTIH